MPPSSIISTSDLISAIALIVTVGGVVVAAVTAWRMKRPEADLKKADTVTKLSNLVNKLVDDNASMRALYDKQISDLQKEVDFLKSLPTRIHRITVDFQPGPEPVIKNSSIGVLGEDVQS